MAKCVGKSCKVVVDDVGPMNIAAKDIIDILQLPTKEHLEPCFIKWAVTSLTVDAWYVLR